MEVVRVPALSDNYVWLLHEPKSGLTAVVDPAEAPPVNAALKERCAVTSFSFSMCTRTPHCQHMCAHPAMVHLADDEGPMNPHLQHVQLVNTHHFSCIPQLTHCKRYRPMALNLHCLQTTAVAFVLHVAWACCLPLPAAQRLTPGV